MTAPSPSLTRYDRRVTLVTEVLMADSAMDEAAARAAAVRVLHVLDRVPEHIR
ncbi:MAG TPA: DUF6307 family protein [Pseudonocardiaceae bacterium]